MEERNDKGSPEPNSEKLLTWKSEIRSQIEIGRRLSQIESALRELMQLAAEAKLAVEGETGFLPEQQREDGSYFSIPSDERHAREAVYKLLDYTLERLDEFRLTRYDLEHLIYLELSCESLLRIMREELRNSRAASLNKILMSAYFVDENVDQIQRSFESVESE